MLNMRSAGDTTTIARIRDVAIALFAEQGYAATTVREVAAAAGVSPALVIHHFGDKASLRRECDEHALGVVLDAKAAARGDLQTLLADYIISSPPELPPATYFARMVLDGTPEGERFFDRMVTESQQAIEHGIGQFRFRPVSDPHAVAALLTAYSFAIVIFNDHVARAFGAPPSDPQTRVRLASAAYELYTKPLLEPLEGETP